MAASAKAADFFNKSLTFLQKEQFCRQLPQFDYKDTTENTPIVYVLDKVPGDLLGTVLAFLCRAQLGPVQLIVFWFGLVKDWGYLGIVALMAMESSIFPVPSEVVAHSPTPSMVSTAASSNGDGKKADAACDR